MAKIEVIEKYCKSCRLCISTCPRDVLQIGKKITLRLHLSCLPNILCLNQAEVCIFCPPDPFASGESEDPVVGIPILFFKFLSSRQCWQTYDMKPQIAKIIEITFNPFILSWKMMTASTGTTGSPNALIAFENREESSKISPVPPMLNTCQITAVHTRFITYDTFPSLQRSISLLKFFPSPLEKSPTKLTQLATRLTQMIISITSENVCLFSTLYKWNHTV